MFAFVFNFIPIYRNETPESRLVRERSGGRTNSWKRRGDGEVKYIEEDRFSSANRGGGKDRRDKTFFKACVQSAGGWRRGKNRGGGRAPARINVPADELLPRNGRVQFASRRRGRVSRAGHVVYKASDHSDGAVYNNDSRSLVIFFSDAPEVRFGAVH